MEDSGAPGGFGGLGEFPSVSRNDLTIIGMVASFIVTVFVIAFPIPGVSSLFISSIGGLAAMTAHQQQQQQLGSPPNGMNRDSRQDYDTSAEQGYNEGTPQQAGKLQRSSANQRSSYQADERYDEPSRKPQRSAPASDTAYRRNMDRQSTGHQGDTGQSGQKQRLGSVDDNDMGAPGTTGNVKFAKRPAYADVSDDE